MQVIKICLFCLILIVLQDSKCQKNVANSNSVSKRESRVRANTNKNINSRFIQIEYQLLTKNCFDESTCLAYIYIRKELFNRNNLIELSNLLNDKNKEKERLRIFFFDDLNLAQAHKSGKKEPQDLENDAKGYFFHNSKEEFLRIKTSEKESENWSSWETVFLRKF